METSFSKYNIKNLIESADYITNITKEEAIEIGQKYSSINSEKQDFIRTTDRDEYVKFCIINPKKRERKSFYKPNNLFVSHVDTSNDWKEYPKRKNSLNFCTGKRSAFGYKHYYVIPLDKLYDMFIAGTQHGDFNWSTVIFKNKSGNEEVMGVHDAFNLAEEDHRLDELKKLITPENLEFVLFKYKDFKNINDLYNLNEKEYPEKKEFYTEMPCLLIAKNYCGEECEEVYEKIKYKNGN